MTKSIKYGVQTFAVTGSLGASLRSAAITYASGKAFQAIGGKFNKSSGFYAKGGAAHIGAHAIAGGVTSVLQGGKFGHGFFSAGVTKAATPMISGIGGETLSLNGYDVAEALAAGLIGGTVSDLTGGKFANGAATAALGNLLNAQTARKRQRFANSRIRQTSSTDGKDHEYSIKGRICSISQSACNSELADSVFADVNKNDVPFHDGDLGSGPKNLIDGVFRPFGNQPIIHTEYPEQRMSVNIALEGHNFYPGDVTHRVYFEAGHLYYEVTGTGNGWAPGFNNFAGQTLFRPGVYQVIKKHGF